MSHETAPAVEKAASGGCCGGKGKDQAATSAVAKPDSKPASDPKDVDHKKAGGSCC